MNDRDRKLGMGSAITRRDFISGVAIGTGALVAGSMGPDLDTVLAQGGSVPYPPALTGLRGSHAGSFEMLHALKDNDFWRSAPTPENTGEEYDLVVVGAGISGLSAAHFRASVKASEALEFGMVGINEWAPHATEAPFGGWKQSGLGHEGGSEGLSEYLETKLVAVGSLG